MAAGPGIETSYRLDWALAVFTDSCEITNLQSKKPKGDHEYLCLYLLQIEAKILACLRFWGLGQKLYGHWQCSFLSYEWLHFPVYWPYFSVDARMGQYLYLPRRCL